MPSYDISLPISDSMWRYQAGWENTIYALSDTNQGDSDSVYRFNLCSHTGTYIESAGHKFANQTNLNELPISAFMQLDTLLLQVTPDADGCITLAEFETALGLHAQSATALTNLILGTDWGCRHTEENYLARAPWFQAELTRHLARLPLHILGVDTPIIDNQQHPYDPVRQLFAANQELLLLAPLNLPGDLPSGTYQLDCPPLNIIDVSAAPCRPVLSKD